ncbi:MAG: PAS domain S-box protein [Desulfobacteraceae bacterium]|nr:PAS domain S-box protein [Desulfobacteraceae bacterium]
MNTYTKILLTTLPLVFFFLIATMGTSYHFSRKALIDLGETWLDTRLSEAMDIVKTQENMLHEYGLGEIAASIAKAKLDAAMEIAVIGVGELGYIFALDQDGIIVFHPNKYLINTDVSSEKWFEKLGSTAGRLVLNMNGKPNLARFESFKEWNWYILAVDPMEEVYGVTNRMKPYLFSLGILAAIIISMALMFLTRRLTRPLEQLVQGAEKIGKGNLDTRISIHTKDEFGHLAKGFNQMASRMQATLTTLQYREEHFRSLTENANDLIWILDAQGIFMYVSPSTHRILGYPPEELMGLNVFDLIHPDDKDPTIQQFNLRVKSIVKPVFTEHRLRHKENYWCTIESISTNLMDHPATRGMVINSRDISKRKHAEQALKRSHLELEKRVEGRTRELLVLNKALNTEILIRKGKEAELKKANQAKSDFLANVSHEIRTPLNSVIGFSELLSTMILEKQQSSYLNAITHAGKNLLTLLNDILDLSKMEAKKLKVHRGPVSLDLIFKEIHGLFNVRLQKKPLEFISEIDSNLPDFLLLDEQRFRQILINLIDNAVKFTNTGHLRMVAKQGKNPNQKENLVHLVIQIEDTGIGISEDKTDIIFESFQQESAGTSRKFGGTGLGLSICRQLVKLMGGTISVSSIPGKGSMFEISLPEVEISKEKPLQKIEKNINPKKINPKILFKNLEPELENRLKEQILPHLPKLQEGMKISDIQKFSEKIITMANESRLTEFEKFGKQLFQHTESFDIENIGFSLEQLSSALKNLDKTA